MCSLMFFDFRCICKFRQFDELNPSKLKTNLVETIRTILTWCDQFSNSSINHIQYLESMVIINVYPWIHGIF